MIHATFRNPRHACTAGLITLCLALLPPAHAAAQDASAPADGRAAQLDAARARKAETLEPLVRSRIERALLRYDEQGGASILPTWRGFRFAGGDMPAGAGTKVGVGFDHRFGGAYLDRPNRVDLESWAAYGTRGYQQAHVGLAVSNIADRPLDLRLRAQAFEYPEEDFFGLGIDSAETDRSAYLLRGLDADASLVWRPARHLELVGGGGYARPRTAAGTDPRFPSTTDRADAATLAGLDASPDYLHLDGGIAFDWRDNPLHPHAGGRYGVRVARYADRGEGSDDFRRVEIALQQYVPLPNRCRTLAVRADATLTDGVDGGRVPFYYQPTLGGAQTLRGFREFRFRDQNALALTAEYRWEAWWALDVALFADAGTVAADRRDLSLKDLKTTYGVGFRLHSNSAFVARLDLAVSREGFIPLLRFEHVF
jgi:hypothetical protein